MSRIVCLDVGDVRIGIAVSDPTRTIAQPVETYTRVGWGPDCRYIKAFCDRYETRELLLGLPLNMDGSAGFQSEKVRAFAKKLEECGLKLHYQDERMTTVTAEDVLIQGNVRREDRKKYVDKIAAAVILEQWLADQSRREGINMENEKKNQDLEEETCHCCHCEEDGCDCEKDGCDCGCEDDEIITLQDEDGNDVDFCHVGTVELDGSYYLLLVTVEDSDDEEEDNGIILKVIQDENGEDCYVTLDDEDEIERVLEKYEEMEEDEAEYGAYDEDEKN